MIKELRGTVLSIEPSGAVIDVGGWGVEVHLPSPDLLTLGTEVSLKTFLCIKQDGIELYGFLAEADRKFFELLLLVPGVGPKTAMSILRKAPREALETAIGARDINYLTRVIGLGKKAAEKLAIELSEKVGGTGKVSDPGDGDVFDTLVALGYTDKEARSAVSNIPSTIEGKDARLKAALSAATH